MLSRRTFLSHRRRPRLLPHPPGRRPAAEEARRRHHRLELPLPRLAHGRAVPRRLPGPRPLAQAAVRRRVRLRGPEAEGRPERRPGRRNSASRSIPPIAEALRCGGDKLAVDAVLDHRRARQLPEEPARADAVPAVRVLQAGRGRVREGRPRRPRVQRQAPVLEVGVGQGDGRHRPQAEDSRSWPGRACRRRGGCRRSISPRGPRSRRWSASPSAGWTVTTSTPWK